jgi:hypothetical protein
MPAAVDEQPPALLERERRNYAIAGLTHRGRHAVEQDLVSAVVAATRAHPLVLSELGRVGLSQLHDRSLTGRVLGLQRIFLSRAAQLPEGEPHEQ